TSTAEAAAVGSVDANPGAANGVRCNRIDNTGLVLCGMDEEPPRLPASGSTNSAVSAREPCNISRAIRPQASQHWVRTSPICVMTARLLCHGGEALRLSSAAKLSGRF